LETPLSTRAAFINIRPAIGSHAFGYYGDKVVMTTETVKKFVAPLFGFDWQGTEVQLIDGLWIRSLAHEPILEQHGNVLSDWDVTHCKRVNHWLCLELPRNSALGEAEIRNLFLLALWTHKPTQTLLAYCFQTEPAGKVTRLLDRVTREPGADSEVTDEDLKIVASYLLVLKALATDSPRAKASLLLTLHGRTAHSWQVAFVCLAAAMESALTYFGKGEGQITERLARAYVAIVNPSIEKRKEVHAEFKRLYGVRSKIVHEAAYRREDSQENLDDLVKLTDLIRDLWKAACSNDEIRQYIEGKNSFRQGVLQKRKGLLENPDRHCCLVSNGEVQTKVGG